MDGGFPFSRNRIAISKVCNMAEAHQIACKSPIEAKIERVLAALKEQDIETSADYLIVRDVKEYLMIRVYRERKLMKAKAKAESALAPETENKK